MPDNSLIIGDIHEPVAHPAYFQFIKDQYDRLNCNRVFFIGDVLDWHGISFHCRHPHAPGVKDEYRLAKNCVQKWYQEFPEATVLIGNHDERPVRLAETLGIPGALLRDYSEVWETPGWQWKFDTVHQDAYLFHGTARGGMFPAFNVMKQMGMSAVMGHVHSVAGIRWSVSPTSRRFGLDTGCGVDDKTYAMAYNRHNKARSIMACGAILDGMGESIIMRCGRGETYDRKRFPQNPLLDR